MSTAAEYMVEQPFAFQSRLRFTRKRRRKIVDPYDPDNTTTGDWTTTDDLEVFGGLQSVSSMEQNDAVRSEVVSSAKFVTDDTSVDIQRGDMLVSADGSRSWEVTGFPAVDQNVFTGWKPTLVATLQEVVG